MSASRSRRHEKRAQQQTVVFLSDFHRGAQGDNVRRLHRLISPILEHCGVRASVYTTPINEQLDPAFWLNRWKTSLVERPVTLPRDLALNNACIIGFEVSAAYCALFSKCGVRWVNIRIHPLRFLDDLYFDVTASFDFSLAHATASLGLISQCVHAISRPNLANAADERHPRLAIIGQTPIDKSVCFGGRFYSLRDYLTKLDRLVDRHSGVVYKPHPYLTDPEVDEFLIHRYDAERAEDLDTYRWLKDARLSTVCGISSSLLHESPHFGVRAVFLDRRAGVYGPPIDYRRLIDDVAFWSQGLLNRPEADSMPPRISQATPPQYLRSVFGCWGYKTDTLFAPTADPPLCVEPPRIALGNISPGIPEPVHCAGSPEAAPSVCSEEVGSAIEPPGLVCVLDHQPNAAGDRPVSCAECNELSDRYHELEKHVGTLRNGLSFLTAVFVETEERLQQDSQLRITQAGEAFRSQESYLHTCLDHKASELAESARRRVELEAIVSTLTQQLIAQERVAVSGAATVRAEAQRKPVSEPSSEQATASTQEAQELRSVILELRLAARRESQRAHALEEKYRESLNRNGAHHASLQDMWKVIAQTSGSPEQPCPPSELAILESARRKLTELCSSSHFWHLEAERYKADLAAVLDSHSWRVMGPVRWLSASIRSTYSLAVMVMARVLSVPWHAGNYMLLHTARRLAKHPWLLRRVSRLLKPFPYVRSRVRLYAVTQGILPLSLPHSPQGSPSEISQTSVVAAAYPHTTILTEPSYSTLGPRAAAAYRVLARKRGGRTTGSH